jgi:hypothetical protein
MSSKFPTFPDISTAEGEAVFDLVVAITEAIGEVEGHSPLAMDDPLFEVVDLELLSQLLGSMQSGEPVDGSVRFETGDVTVIVDTDGTVTAQTDQSIAHRRFECPPTDRSGTGGISYDV